MSTNNVIAFPKKEPKPAPPQLIGWLCGDCHNDTWLLLSNGKVVCDSCRRDSPTIKVLEIPAPVQVDTPPYGVIPPWGMRVVMFVLGIVSGVVWYEILRFVWRALSWS